MDAHGLRSGNDDRPSRPRSWLIPFRGIADDVRARLPFYASDWSDGLFHGRTDRKLSHGILAPALYIFAASVLPALAFGQQLASATSGTLTPLQVVFSTAIGGIIQSLFGGQPLLIVGVAEPIVVIYVFLFEFARQRDVEFLPWCAWICVFTGIFLVILAVSNACKFISHFTRFAGESFGLLIAVLFGQVAVLGMIDEFRPLGLGHATSGSGNVVWSPWILVNGLWALFLSFGLTLTSLTSRGARSWRFLNGSLRALVADYGVPLLLVCWTALSYALSYSGPDSPESIPRRVVAPSAWDSGALDGFSKTAGRMTAVPGGMIAAALVPALIISILFYFDHMLDSAKKSMTAFRPVSRAARLPKRSANSSLVAGACSSRNILLTTTRRLVLSLLLFCRSRLRRASDFLPRRLERFNGGDSIAGGIRQGKFRLLVLRRLILVALRLRYLEPLCLDTNLPNSASL